MNISLTRGRTFRTKDLEKKEKLKEISEELGLALGTVNKYLRY
jgi:hypothetical protein